MINSIRMSKQSSHPTVQLFSRLTWLVWFSGLLGALAVSSGVMISALSYSGKDGRAYSFFNQFISELGDVGVASNAWAFNLGLILGGIFLLLFNLGMGLLTNGKLAKLAMLVGAAAAVALSLVGFFPMNILEQHTLAALTYFRLTLLTILLFTTAFYRLPKNQALLPGWIQIFGLLALGFYIAFLVVIQVRSGEINLMLNPGSLASRPQFWLTPMLEWGIFFSTLLWVLLIALNIRCRA